MTSGLVILFVGISLLLSAIFLYTAGLDLKMAQAGHNHNDGALRHASAYVGKRALLGGALAINRLFWILVILWSDLPWSGSPSGPALLLVVWVFNESITLWGWYKTR